jgi:hypothetical protein
MKNTVAALKFLLFTGALIVVFGGFVARASAASTYVITTGALGDSTAGANQRKMARTSDGVYHVVYHKLNADGYYQIYCADSADGGQTWTETPLISGPLISSISHDNRPSIISDSQDNLYVVWWGKSVDSPTYNQIRFLKYSHATHAWGSVQTLTSGNYDQTMSSMTVDSADNVYIAWNGEDAASPSYTQIRFVKYTAATDSWSAVADLTSEGYDQQRPFITADYEDNLQLTWYGEDALSPGFTQIRYEKYSSGGWGAIYDITSGNYTQDFVSLAVDSQDNVHVTWRGTDATSPTVSQIKYVEYVKTMATWGSVVTFSNEQYGRGQYNSYIAIDSSDHIHIVWNGRIASPNNDYVIRYVENLGSGWSAPIALTDDVVDNQYANLIWYVNPIVGNARINRSKDGYAFIWSSGTTIYFYKSDDLAWETPTVRHAAGSGVIFVPPPASVSIIRPSAGRQLKPGTVTAIDWTTENAVFARFRISYSADGGQGWDELASADGTIDSFSWTVPNEPVSNGLVRVEGLDAAGAVVATAESGVFSISGVEIGAPSAGTPANPPYNASDAQAAAPDINTDLGLVATANPLCVSGSLVKGLLLAVYYCGADGKRYVFPNDRVYFSWYADFSAVKIISDIDLAKIPLGGNITYRPGVKMVKAQSDPKVYAVAQGGVLRWISSEAVAVHLYGADWNKEIDDIPDSFFADYKVGEPL